MQPHKTTMRSPLENLSISTQELESQGLSFIDELAIALHQAITDKQLKGLLSVVITQVFMLGVLLILILPMGVIVLRRFQVRFTNPQTLVLLVIAISVLSIVMIFVGNVALWRRTRQLKTLAQLMANVSQFNRLVQSVQMIDHWKHLSPSSSSHHSRNREEAIAALWLTREGLIHALNAEKLTRFQSNLVAHADVVATLENNLTRLMTFNSYDAIDEYSHLFNEILLVNMSVHREIATLRVRY